MAVRLATIGCGRFGSRVHYPSLTSFDDVEIAGICDLDEERLNAIGDRFGIDARYAEFPKMLDEVKPDAVYVIMPEDVRFPVVREVLERGYPVFMEKPPARTTEEIRELARIAEEKHLITMVACNRRFIPVLVEARRRMRERGPVTQVMATYYKNAIAATVKEREDPDVLVCDGIHAVDTLRWLAGSDAVRVQAVSRSIGGSYTDTWQAVVEFQSGCIGVLLLSWACGNRYHAFEIHTRGASAFIVPEQGARIVADGAKEPAWTMPSTASLDNDATYLRYGFLQEDRHFIDCIKSGRPTDSPFSDAVKSMELIDMIKAACLSS